MSILVFIEQRDGQVRSVSREALGEATRLATALGGPVIGVCAAADDPGLAKLGEAGAEKVLLARDPRFRLYDAAATAAAVEAASRQVNPALVLFPGSAM